MTNDELDRLEALAAAATPARCDDIMLTDDAAFIAAAREAVPRLVAEVRRLAADVAEAEIGGFLMPRPPICASAFGPMPDDTRFSVSSSRGLLSYEIRFDVPTGSGTSPADAFDRAIEILRDAKARMA